MDRTHNGAESLQEEPLLIFFDFLCHEPTVQSLEGFLSSSNLSRVPYLKSLMTRIERHVPGSSPTLPTAHELFHKFYHIDLHALAGANHGEMLTFSNPRLSQRYGSQAQLNYTHYLKQHRSAYAVYYFLMEQLQLYGQITRTQLFHACETATQLALQHAGDDELVAHCVACCEMLDFDTQNLRSFLHLQRTFPPAAATSYVEQLQHWDQALVEQLQHDESENEFPLQSYTALMRLGARNMTGKCPTAMLQHFAARNDWWRVLLILQYYDLPLSELQLLLPHFKYSAMGVHLLRALSYNCSSERQHKRATTRQLRRSDSQANSSQETMTNSSHSSGLEAQLQQLQRDSGQSMCNLLTQNARQDLFAIILCSSNQLPDECIGSMARFVELMQSNAGPQCTSVQLLKHCVRQQMPILAVLASTLSVQNLDWCWLLWLAVASGQWQQFVHKSREQLLELDYVWSLIRSVVSAGQLNALLHSFIIFQPVRESGLIPSRNMLLNSFLLLLLSSTVNLCTSAAS